MHKTTSVPIPAHEIDLPASTIYVTEDGTSMPAGKPRFKTPISDTHFLLILKPDLMTQESISDCKGEYRCLNCGRLIFGPIYFVPERYNPQTNEPTCKAIPHCRKSCVYRTVHDSHNNGDLLTNFFLMYGHDVVCAPPRLMLFIPGGYTLEDYHRVIDEGKVVEEQDNLVHAFLAPILIACTVQKDHQLLPDAVRYITELEAKKQATIGPTHKQPKTSIVALPPKILSQTPLSQVFTMEPASFGRTGIAGNPHMGEM